VTNVTPPAECCYAVGVTAIPIFERAEDAERFERVIGAVASFVRGLPIVTGSFAVEWNIGKAGGRVVPRRLNDIDLVVEDASAISPAISGKFLVHHFHPTREKGNVLMQLVDPETATRVDIFSARSASVTERSHQARSGGVDVLVLSAEDLAARLLAIVVIVLDGRTVDPKYFESFSRLLEVVDRNAVSRLWQEYRWGNYAGAFLPTAEKVMRRLHDHPELLKPIEYPKDVDAACGWCVETEDFPIADRREVFRLLGYV
jgi:hypothetical protein